jgi:ATP-dependent Clp protease ATP-binding subunit ClpX
MLIGPTGAGKTHIIKTLCSLFDVPFVKVDCSQLIVSGYVGLQVENALTMIYLKAKNKSEAEQGVIYFDEFDKIKESSKSKSLGGSNLQYEFLSLFDDDEKMINVDMSKYADRMSFKTTKLMFIFSGSFFGIESNIKKRINQHTIGYSNNLLSQNLSASELQKELTPQDFIEFGIIPELIGRISYYVALDNLTRAQIVEIIKNTENSFLSGFENYFWLHYNKLIIDEDVYGLIADKVIENNLGARTIKSILQKLLAESLFKSANPVMNTYHITKEYYYKIIGK